jgi:myosin heavy subunit
MNNLMIDLLGSCDLHFIRCVKSNNFKAPMMMEDEVVYNQICYLGVLDTIKLKKQGYCIKLEFEAIDKRFPWLVRHYFREPAFPKEIMKALKNFLPRFDQD